MDRIGKHVTPLAGVWIETSRLYDYAYFDSVTPLAGVWIETLLGSIGSWTG